MTSATMQSSFRASHILRFLVLEGPAGSGKSTLAKTLVSTYPDLYDLVPPLVDLPRPRAYLGYEGVIRSQLKDVHSSLSMISQLVGGNPRTLIVDRWVVSQWVYGAIRRRGDLSAYAGIASMKHALAHLDHAYHDYFEREGEIPGTLTTFMNLVVWNPALSVLSQFRHSAKRDFPYDGGREQILYGKVPALLRSSPLFTQFDATRYLRVEGYSLSDLKYYDQAVETVHKIAYGG